MTQTSSIVGRCALPFVFLASLGSLDAQVLENGDQRVEFVGLGEWTPERVRDRLRPPGHTGPIHYCAANLKADVGMAEASVCYYPPDEVGAYVLVTVVEPAARDRVRLREIHALASAPIPGWRGLIERLQERSLSTQLAILGSVGAHRDGVEKALAGTVTRGVDAAVVRRLWKALRGFRSAAAFQRAAHALAHHADAKHRSAAAVILSSFGDRDLSWWCLVDGLRDPDAGVRSSCGQVLISLSRHAPRTVDWSPVSGSLRAILGGTNLFALTHVMKMLTATGVAKDQAPVLLARNGQLILGYLGVSRASVRALARGLLVRLRGADLGSDVKPWQEWISTLDAK